MDLAEWRPDLDTPDFTDPNAIAEACKKRSFLKLPVPIDKARLCEEFARIPAEAWGASLWDVHCSIDMVLLRGGQTGRADDFTTDDVANSPLLERLPYIASLLAPEGPFGGAVYAFIFRTKPNGLTRQHEDDWDAWKRTVRIHFPIVTNPGAVLLVRGRSKHLEVGEVWSFNNQVVHSVVNGGETRVHMIIDVRPNPKLAALMSTAEWDRGQEDPERWELTGHTRRNYRFALGEPLSASEKAALQLEPEGFATRVTEVRKRARLTGYSPLRVGDVIYAVNDVTSSHLSRTALDHLYIKLKPDSVAQLDIVRGGQRQRVSMRLRSPEYFSADARLRGLAKPLRPVLKPLRGALKRLLGRGKAPAAAGGGY